MAAGARALGRLGSKLGPKGSGPVVEPPVATYFQKKGIVIIEILVSIIQGISFSSPKTYFQKSRPGENNNIPYVCEFYENQKAAQRYSDQFGGSIAPRSPF